MLRQMHTLGLPGLLQGMVVGGKKKMDIYIYVYINFCKLNANHYNKYIQNHILLPATTP